MDISIFISFNEILGKGYSFIQSIFLKSSIRASKRKAVRPFFLPAKQSEALCPGLEGIFGLQTQQSLSKIAVFDFVECRRNKIKKEHPGQQVYRICKIRVLGYDYHLKSQPILISPGPLLYYYLHEQNQTNVIYCYNTVWNIHVYIWRIR